MTPEDVVYMQRAVAEARRCAAEDDRIHPFVGVVVTAAGEVATAFRGELAPGQHAEFVALEGKLGDRNLAGATVFTTLEPCTTRNHPKVPCAERLVERRVRRVLIGMLDPNPSIRGEGVLRLRRAGIEVQLFPHDLMAELEDLNRHFIRAQTTPKLAVPGGVSRPEEAATLDPEACESLAQTFSQRGDHPNAISWASRSLSHALATKDGGRVVRNALLLAQQYRHQGIFNESLRFYAIAEDHVRSQDLSDFRTKLDLLRILAGRIMVERFLVEGNPRTALREYDSLESRLNELETGAKADRATRRVTEIYRLHWERQRAEMLRQLGYYEKARRAFHDLFQRYEFSEVSSKAWCLLGEGEAYRVLGDRSAALACYGEVEDYSRKVSDARLLARVLRNKGELHRTHGDDADEILAELKDLADRTGYAFGKVYYLLSRAAQSLQSGNLDEARERLVQAQGLCLMEGQPFGLEGIHCTLGLAEVHRLAADWQKARSLLCEASSHYRDRGVAWGYLRAELALRVLEPSRRPPSKAWTARGDSALQRLQALSRKSSTLPSLLENLL